MSTPAKDLLKRLLSRNLNKRLGATGARRIKRHPWFKSIDWKQAKER
jgi:hypothetical protein